MAEHITLRAEVQEFAQLMEKELRANDHKSGWRSMKTKWLLARIKDEVAELEAALASGDVDKIASECADVGNFAMMLADKAKYSKELYGDVA
jgi:NTP pyrophosphatase (non-canonical NTP hydrolase)